MICWRCEKNDTQTGQMLCDECRGIHEQQEEDARKNVETKQRHKPDPFTHIYFCRTCGVEVYRREHVRVKTKRVLTDTKQRAKLALFQHMERVGHERASLSGDLRINERFGDDGFEVTATEEKCPSHMRASNVLRGVIGGL